MTEFLVVLMVIILFAIGGYWWLLMVIILFAIGGYWWVLMATILLAIVDIGDY